MKIKTICKLIFGLLVITGVLLGQTTVTSTTLSANIAANLNQFTVAAATGIVAPTATTPGSVLLVDKEAMRVTGLSGTRVSAVRGTNGTVAVAHRSGAVVWLGAPGVFREGPDPAGQCTRTTLAYVPVINVSTGNTFDCLGVTTAGQYVQTNAPGPPVFGSVVTPATSITPTGTLFATDSGATGITTIVVPAGWAAGMCIEVVPGGTGATSSSGGNIGLTTSALVAGRVIRFCWNGTSWYPSYVS